MRALVYLFISVLILSACKDPNLGPNEEEVPKQDTGYMQFDSPAVGQKSSYAHFLASGYWGSSESPISYTRDTIYWEVT